MSRIPDCRTDEYYNEKYLISDRAWYVAGFDYAVQAGMNNWFDNVKESLDADEALDDSELPATVELLTPDNILGILAGRPDLLEVIKERLNQWVELERDQLITSAIDNYSETVYEHTKLDVDYNDKKNVVVIQQEQIGKPFKE